MTVRDPYVIDAANDSTTSLAGRTVLVSVLANDTLGGGPATLANVKVAFVSSTNPGITLEHRERIRLRGARHPGRDPLARVPNLRDRRSGAIATRRR